MRVTNNPEEKKKMGNIEKLLQENLEIAKDTQEKIRKIGRYIFWRKVWGWTRFVLILIPLALAFVYLPPYIEKAYEMYQGVLSPFVSGGGMESLKNVGGLIEGFKDLPGEINLDRFKIGE